MRWLTETEQVTWRRYILATNLLDQAIDRQLTKDSRLAHAHYAVLVALSEAPDRRLRMSDLARQVRFSLSRMTHAIASLERRGWVRREPCPTDRRGQVAIITDDGLATLERAAPGHVSEVRALVFDRLTAEQVAALDEICSTLLAGLDPEVAADAGVDVGAAGIGAGTGAAMGADGLDQRRSAPDDRASPPRAALGATRAGGLGTLHDDSQDREGPAALGSDVRRHPPARKGTS